MDPEAGQASRKLTAELLRADKWRAQKTGESIFPRMRAPRNYFSQHCSPPPPPLLFFFYFFFLFFFFFSLLAAFPRIENRVSRHMSRNVIFICTFITSLVLDSTNTLFLSNIIARENPPFPFFLLPFLFSLSLFSFL